MNRRSSKLPSPLAIPIVLATALFALPILGLLLRTPWSDLYEQLSSPEVLSSLRLSMICSVTAAALSAGLGLPMAMWLAAERPRADSLRTLVRILITLPMVLPPVVAGVAMLLAFGRHGTVGASLDQWLGLTLPFTTWGVVLAETYVAMPFFILTAESGLRSFDQRYAAAAQTLGASPWRSFYSVTLPMIAPSLRAGLLVAWARALGEFGATMTFAGNLEGSTRTMPLAVFGALETNSEAAIALSVILVIISGCILFLLRRQWFPRR